LQEQQEYCWTTCPLSQRPLKAPIVSDCGGNLYNKDAIIEFLIPSEDPVVEAAKIEQEKLLNGRVKSFKDVVEIKFQIDEDKKSERGGERWKCPVTDKALGPGVRSVYLVPCGHAFQDVAIKEVSQGQCLQCDEPFDQDNVVVILPLKEEERTRLVSRAKKLKEHGLTHSLKKAPGSSKKRKKGAAAAETANVVPSLIGGEADKKTTSNGAASQDSSKPVAPAIKNTSTASLTAKVLAEEQEKAKRRKLEQNNNIQGLFTSSTSGREKHVDFMTRGFSIPATAKK